MQEKRFSYQNAEYVALGSKTAELTRIKEACDHFIVPSVVFSPEGQKYKLIKICYSDNIVECDELKNIFDSYHLELVIYWKKQRAEIISFDESSEIEEIPISFIHICKSRFILPPNVKRIVIDTFIEENLPSVQLARRNQFVSISKNRSIMNNHPLELLSNVFVRSRLFVRETVRFIGVSSYSNQVNIEKVVITSSVEVIDDYSFFFFTSLERIAFKGKSHLKRIGYKAFYYLTLSSIDFPSSVEVIDGYAFSKNQFLSSVTFSKNSSLKCINEEAFSLTAITKVDFPASLETIGQFAFCECINLSIITFQNNSKLKIIERGAFQSTNIKSIDFPSSIENIEEYAFFECKNLSMISFNQGSKLFKIGENSFLDCVKLSRALLNVDINYLIIGENAFKNCPLSSNLTES